MVHDARGWALQSWEAKIWSQQDSRLGGIDNGCPDVDVMALSGIGEGCLDMDLMSANRIGKGCPNMDLMSLIGRHFADNTRTFPTASAPMVAFVHSAMAF